eukprot:883220-Prymnesium_polylepis.1
MSLKRYRLYCRSHGLEARGLFVSPLLHNEGARGLCGRAATRGAPPLKLVNLTQGATSRCHDRELHLVPPSPPAARLRLPERLERGHEAAGERGAADGVRVHAVLQQLAPHAGRVGRAEQVPTVGVTKPAVVVAPDGRRLCRELAVHLRDRGAKGAPRHAARVAARRAQPVARQVRPRRVAARQDRGEQHARARRLQQVAHDREDAVGRLGGRVDGPRPHVVAEVVGADLDHEAQRAVFSHRSRHLAVLKPPQQVLRLVAAKGEHERARASVALAGVEAARVRERAARRRAASAGPLVAERRAQQARVGHVRAVRLKDGVAQQHDARLAVAHVPLREGDRVPVAAAPVADHPSAR